MGCGKAALAMVRGIVIAAWIALLPIGAQAAPDPVVCRVPVAPQRANWKLKSFEMQSPSLRCREMVAATRTTMRSLTPSRRSGATDFHVRMEDVSTAREIRFEARAWAVSSNGRHLRHVSRAVASVRHTARDRERMSARIARLALNRVLRELMAD